MAQGQPESDLLEQLITTLSTEDAMGARIPEIQRDRLDIHANTMNRFCVRTMNGKVDDLDSVVGVVEQRLEEASHAIEMMQLYDPEEGTEMSEMFENLQVTAEEMRGLTEDMNRGIRQTRLGARVLREQQEDAKEAEKEPKSSSKAK